ncbi:hypothetical protein KKG72_07380 [bacterium]|nr:hypothetical protein [bacterium]MBU1994069.1 hypothetical protein [bacterium]
MSLKSNIDMVKEELNSEEKFFEKAVITERFVKKYKNAIIASVVAVIVIVGTNIAYEVNKQNKIDAANEALLELSKDAKNTSALTNLKSLSPELYDVWLFSKAIADKDTATLNELKNSKALIVGDLASYELAQTSKDLKALNEYASKQNSIYRELAHIQSAVILMNDGKTEQAHQELSKVSEQSSLGKLARALMHYGVK